MNQLSIKIFADGADKNGILEMYKKPYISGFTTNPTLMKKAGITNYTEFAKDILSEIPDRPVSLEVFADDFAEMERQALLINSWGGNVYVKIPITNTKAEPSYKLIQSLTKEKVKLNITAVMTLEQVLQTVLSLKGTESAIVSVFAGRIADSGIDPIPHMRAALEITNMYPNIELLWASPREVLNIIQADEMGCNIITVTNDLLKKLDTLGKDLQEFSLDTVKMFYNDASNAGYQI
ncbi:MAG: transaldolase [Leptospiraceae bacterium]|nr:transaldolase [Leptospiraceae bacterium]MCP5496150.1 transaldolase [Leptospiraceae bacterium]